MQSFSVILLERIMADCNKIALVTRTIQFRITTNSGRPGGLGVKMFPGGQLKLNPRSAVPPAFWQKERIPKEPGWSRAVGELLTLGPFRRVSRIACYSHSVPGITDWRVSCQLLCNRSTDTKLKKPQSFDQLSGNGRVLFRTNLQLFNAQGKHLGSTVIPSFP
jgi:hypothetical protein